MGKSRSTHLLDDEEAGVSVRVIGLGHARLFLVEAKVVFITAGVGHPPFRSYWRRDEASKSCMKEFMRDQLDKIITAVL
jgi:predicted ferric reductase